LHILLPLADVSRPLLGWASAAWLCHCKLIGCKLIGNVWGCLLLFMQSVMRGPSYVGGDAVEEAVMAMVHKDIDEEDGTSSSNSTAAAGGSTGSFDIATASSWPGVPAGDVLVAPHEARMAWRDFMTASSLSVQQVRYCYCPFWGGCSPVGQGRAGIV
jgi:hypothetical protein